jgi:hypothetical protein
MIPAIWISAEESLNDSIEDEDEDESLYIGEATF